MLKVISFKVCPFVQRALWLRLLLWSAKNEGMAKTHPRIRISREDGIERLRAAV